MKLGSDRLKLGSDRFQTTPNHENGARLPLYLAILRFNYLTKTYQKPEIREIV